MHVSGFHIIAALFTMLLLVPACASNIERAAWDDLDREASSLELRDRNQETASGEEAAIASPDGSENLDDYLYLAGMHHPGLRAAFHRWQAALEKVPQSKAWPEPRLSYGVFLREVETRVGPQKQRFGITQRIPWPTKITQQGDVALRRAMVGKYRYEGEKLRLFYEVKKAYYEYYYLARSIAVVEDNLKLLKNLEAAVRARYKAGSAKQPALIQTQIELGKLEDRLNSLKALQPALEAKLNSAIGWDSDTHIPWPESEPEEPPPLDEETLRSTLLEYNPALDAARQEIQAAHAEKELSGEAYWPDFNVGATYIQTDRRNDADPRDNGKDPFLLTFEVSLPLWYKSYDAGGREADARILEARAQRDDLENRLSATLSTVLYYYEDAGRKLDLFRSTLVPKAEQALKTAQSAFSSGTSGFLEMIDAERHLLEFRLLAERAQIDRNIRFAELEMLCGRSLRQ